MLASLKDLHLSLATMEAGASSEAGASAVAQAGLWRSGHGAGLVGGQGMEDPSRFKFV